MKKLILSVVAVCASIVANAAAINWASGAIQTPTSDTDGTLSGNKVNTASGFNVKMYVWESLTASAVSYSAGDLFKWYSDGQSDTKDPFGTSITTLSKAPTTGASATTATVNGTIVPATDGTSVYAAVLFVLEDATSGDAKWYIENSGSKASAKSAQTLGNLSLKIGGTGAATIWIKAPVTPEPTSAMLMLIGMAGLALRRKRA